MKETERAPEREGAGGSLSEAGSQGRRQGEDGRESGDKGQSERQEAVLEEEPHNLDGERGGREEEAHSLL